MRKVLACLMTALLCVSLFSATSFAQEDMYEAETETGSETGSETGGEKGSDTGGETGSETGSETGTESGGETEAGSGTETGSVTETEEPSSQSSSSSPPSPALTPGCALTPVSQIFPEINVDDTVVLAISASHIQDFESLRTSKLSAVMSDADAACFERSFVKDGKAVLLRLTAKSAKSYGSVSVYVTDGTNSSATCTFSTAIKAPKAKIPVLQPAPAPEADPGPEPGSNTQSPLSPEPEPGSQSPLSPEPEPGSQSPLSPGPEPGSQSPSGSEPEPGSQSPSGSEPESGSQSPPSSPPWWAGIFSAPRGATTTIDPATPGVIPQGPPAAPVTIGNQGIIAINDTATAGKWTVHSGLPSLPATLVEGKEIIFNIPDNNFIYSETTASLADNLTKIKTTFAGNVKVMDGSQDRTGYFDVDFVGVGTDTNQSFRAVLTVKDNIPDGGVTLDKDTTFSFDIVPNKYALPAPLNLLRAASGSTKADGITSGAVLGDGVYSWVSKNGSYYRDGLGGYTLDDVEQGDEFLIHFYPQFFTWSGATPAKATLSNIRGKIGFRQTGSSGSRVFEAVELTSYKGEAVVRVKFKDPIATTKAIDFKTTLYMTVGGRRDEDSKCEIEGTLGDQDPEEFYASDRDYIDISDGFVGIAMENISRAKVYIGDGVTLHVPHIRKNAKFYGVAVANSPDRRDIEFFDKYPDIHEVYTLYTLGLNGANTTVDIDTYGGYYVYDADLNYLGRSLRNLPYSDRYYLAVKMLDIDDDDGDWDDDWDEPPEITDYPGAVPPPNDNDNPSTGR